jgi:hypothetical protein
MHKLYKKSLDITDDFYSCFLMVLKYQTTIFKIPYNMVCLCFLLDVSSWFTLYNKYSIAVDLNLTLQYM